MTSTYTERVLTARATVAANLTTGLTARGFGITPKGDHRLVVTHGTLGELATLDFYTASLTGAGVLTGEVRLVPRVMAYTRGRSVYKLDATGFVNMTGLIKRLTSEIGKVTAWIASVRADRVREAADSAIRSTLGVPPPGVEIGVYDGTVDLKLSELTPARAARVLTALSEGD